MSFSPRNLVGEPSIQNQFECKKMSWLMVTFKCYRANWMNNLFIYFFRFSNVFVWRWFTCNVNIISFLYKHFIKFHIHWFHYYFFLMSRYLSPTLYASKWINKYCYKLLKKKKMLVNIYFIPLNAILYFLYFHIMRNHIQPMY